MDPSNPTTNIISTPTNCINCQLAEESCTIATLPNRMSSQARGIPLHNVPDNVGYRLLELPPDLLSLLESNDAPV